MGRFSPPLAYWYLRQKQLGYPGAGGGNPSGGGGADTTAPAIFTSDTFSQVENSAFSISLTASEAVTWTKTGGADAALFTLSSGVLSLAAQDYEAPADADVNNTYVVQVTATDGAGNASVKTITVTITDVTEVAGPAGVLDFSDLNNSAHVATIGA